MKSKSLWNLMIQYASDQMTVEYNYFVDYNHASDASIITWTHEDEEIEDCEPFVDFIRCDLNGEEYEFLYSDEEDFISKIDNFGAIKGNVDDEYFLCYTADFYIPKLNSKKQFVRALKFSNNDVEVVLGFKNRDGEILEDCIEENTNSTTKFSQIDQTNFQVRKLYMFAENSKNAASILTEVSFGINKNKQIAINK